MLLDTTTIPAVRIRAPQVVFAPHPDTGGTLSVHPAFAKLFAHVGLTCAAAFLDLPGEVVSGHADRHALRVNIPGVPRAFYLKRQHVVGWREKLRTRLAGFGWASRCEREAKVLGQLGAANLPAPRWAACGTHRGRAFVLVEEVHGGLDLRRLLSDNVLSLDQRRLLAVGIGEALARVHAAGFGTPDLSAKHVLVNRHTLAVTFLDWPGAARGAVTGAAGALGALHASLAGPLASRADRVRALKAYRGFFFPSPLAGEGGESSSRVKGEASRALSFTPHPSAKRRHPLPQGERDKNSVFTANVLQAAARHATRRSIRDQLQLDAPSQRLVWLAGEAVCAIPEIVAAWPRPAISPPFYGDEGDARVRIADRDAVLVRGHTSAPLGRLRAWMRATPWRSAGVTIGRVLFHLQRYGVHAPQLLAFGQRLTGPTRAEWFALYEVPPGVPLRIWRQTASSVECRALSEEVARAVDKLHAASCVLTDAQAAFAVCDGRVSIADPRAIRIVRRVSDSTRASDHRDAARLLGAE